MKIRQSVWTALSAILLAAVSAHAGFQYNAQDVLVGFRKSGGASELVVNAGSISNIYSLPVGTKITINNLNSGLLGAAFDDLNDLSFSASACSRVFGGSGLNTYGTLWVTRPRADINVQTSPWSRNSTSSQGSVASQIAAIGENAVTYGNTQSTGTNNTSGAVIIPHGSTYDYSTQIGTFGNFANTFQGDVETTTSDSFTDDGQPVRADLYQLLPGSGAGTYLGFFELSPEGVLTYTAGPSASALTPPTITGITRNGTDTIVSFNTVSSAHYSLCFTDSSGLSSPVTTWPTIGPVTGTGSVMSLTNSTAAANQFYRVMAAP